MVFLLGLFHSGFLLFSIWLLCLPFLGNKLLNFSYLLLLPWIIFGFLGTNLSMKIWFLFLPSLWFPPLMGSVKGNFDVAVHDSFVVPAAVISDSLSNIVLAAMHKLPSTDVLQGEAFAALLATLLAVSCGCNNFFLEGDALLVLLAVNNPFIFSSWSFSSIVCDISYPIFKAGLL